VRPWRAGSAGEAYGRPVYGPLRSATVLVVTALFATVGMLARARLESVIGPGWLYAGCSWSAKASMAAVTRSPMLPPK
jgi:hypothetical protein